jgi:hypothetical protein
VSVEGDAPRQAVEAAAERLARHRGCAHADVSARARR